MSDRGKPRTADARKGVLPVETVDEVGRMCTADTQVYLPAPIVYELVRGYRRYLAITAPK